jgi:endonuclease YncB( thermonuclease family)
VVRHRSLLAPFAVLGLAVLALGDPPKPADPAAAPTTIYRVGKGERYHLASCKECKKKGAKVAAITPAKAEEAKLTPCSKCNPPALDALAPAPAPKSIAPVEPAKPTDPAKPAEKPANSAKSPTATTFFSVGEGDHYHLQSCSVCKRKGVFIGNALTMAEVAEAGLIPCTKCKPPDRKPTITLGKVILIEDADTVVLDDGKKKHNLRLEGIDAPETRGKQAFNAESMAALSAKLLDKDVKVEWLQRDRDKRLLGHVYLGERWINLEMVAEGFAWHFTKYNKDQRLSNAEKAARAKGIGLWRDKNAISPDDFRARKKATAQE